MDLISSFNSPVSISLSMIIHHFPLIIFREHISALRPVISASTFTQSIIPPENMTSNQFCDDLMSSDPDVSICEPDVEFMIDQNIVPSPPITNDALSSQQWGLNEIGITDAWDAGIRGDSRVRICIMDSGVDTTHPDIQQNLWINPAPTMDDVLGASFLKGVASNKIADKNGVRIRFYSFQLSRDMTIGIADTGPTSTVS